MNVLQVYVCISLRSPYMHNYRYLSPCREDYLLQLLLTKSACYTFTLLQPIFLCEQVTFSVQTCYAFYNLIVTVFTDLNCPTESLLRPLLGIVYIYNSIICYFFHKQELFHQKSKYLFVKKVIYGTIISYSRKEKLV